MTNVLSAMMWGSPTATKHALLLHGLTASSDSWHSVASGLAAQGYLVTAPNLAGDASRAATDRTVRAIADDLRPYLQARSYSLIMGHSFGALVVLALLPFLPAHHPTAIVLVDPPLYLAPEHEVLLCDSPRVNTEHAGRDVCAVEKPLWSREDCVSMELSMRLCPAQTVLRSAFETRLSTKWKMTALVADPGSPVETLCSFSHVRPVVVPGAGHCIPNEFPEVVVAEALKTVVESEVALARQWLQCMV